MRLLNIHWRNWWMKQNKAREEIVKLFLDCLEKEDIPWHQGFMPSKTSFNPITKTVYKNSNRFILYMNEYVHQYKDPRWMTFKQASAAGYHIRKGEKGVPIEYWSIYDSKEKKNLSFSDYQELLKNNPERQDDIRFISRVYTVFNAKQMDGIQPYADNLSNKKDGIDEHFSLPYYLLYRFGKSASLDIVEDNMVNTPFYSPLKDRVVVPNHHRYHTSDGFFSDAFHEIAHATSHSSRLNRMVVSAHQDIERYAIEELKAEIASAFICHDIGIIPQPHDDYIKNSQAYIQNWIKVIKDKPNALFSSIKEAEGISDYVMEKGEYSKLKDIQKFIDEAITEGIYQSDVLNKDDIRLMLSGDIKEISNEYMGDIIDQWCNGNKGDPRVYYAFDNDKVIIADNTSNDMFVEEFDKEDYLLAYLWLKEGMAIDELKDLKYHNEIKLTNVR